MDLAYSKEHIDTFVVLSGDSDFSPLVSKLKELGKHVIGLGMQDSTSDLLRDNCDEFIYYEDLGQAPTLSPAIGGHLPEMKRKAFALLLESLLALRRENKEVLWSSMVKDTMKRKKPSFNETYHGYRTFSELLEDAQHEGLLELETDKRSRTYVVTRFGSEMHAPPEAAAAPPAPAAAAASSTQPAPGGPIPGKKKSRRRRSGKRKGQGILVNGTAVPTMPAGEGKGDGKVEARPEEVRRAEPQTPPPPPARESPPPEPAVEPVRVELPPPEPQVQPGRESKPERAIAPEPVPPAKAPTPEPAAKPAAKSASSRAGAAKPRTRQPRAPRGTRTAARSTKAKSAETPPERSTEAREERKSPPPEQPSQSSANE
jgi:hypothetical protein